MQPFVLYNSEQRKKVEFVPRVEGHIDMYVSGMTVYVYCHIGHARVKVGALNTFVILPTLTIKLFNVPMKMAKALRL